jgi:nucleoside-diphosphate-sugar epimerase
MNFNRSQRDWTLEDDLKDIFSRTSKIWVELEGAKLFITGGTGFIGCWLLETLRHAHYLGRVEFEIYVLTRNLSEFQKKAPHLASYSAFNFIEGNLVNFVAPEAGFTHLIHAATDASAYLNEHDPRSMFDTVVLGTRHVLNFAVENGIKKVLFLSSGAVYGQQPWDMSFVDEDCLGSPDCRNPKNTYAEAKRAAEMLCAIYGKQFKLSITTARIFALLGPYISLGIHFAAGNFIRDAIDGKTVTVNGNGLPCRSYMYASDLTVWLFNLLVFGQAGCAYNVGSDETISIKDLAEKVANIVGSGRFEIKGEADAGWNPGRYVPDVSKITRELNQTRNVGLDEAIRRTALWNGWKNND